MQAPWARLASPPPAPQPALDPDQLAAALRSRLGANLPQGPSFGVQPPAWSKAAAKAPPNGAPAGEDLAAKLRNQLMSRPELRNALEKAKAEIAAQENDADKTKPETSDNGAKAGDVLASESEKEETSTWPPSTIRFTPEALDAAVDAARALDKEWKATGALTSEDPEKLVEVAAIAGLTALKDQGKLPEDAIVPKLKVETAEQEKEGKAENEVKQKEEEQEEEEEEDKVEKKEEEDEKDEPEETKDEEKDQVDEEANKDKAEGGDSAVEDIVETVEHVSESLMPANADVMQVEATVTTDSSVPLSGDARRVETVPDMQSSQSPLGELEPSVIAASEDMRNRRDSVESKPVFAQSTLPIPTPVVNQQNTPAGCNFVLNVEELAKGERVYRYVVSPSTDIDGCFRNVRRRIEMELEDGLTVQMCLQRRR
mmetsp:Transcript_23072/g.36859  ORF Transcript_23072/g.36859 Transcript_23072/m.36859 type:complete len:428 (+) Transcript_23072:110-1393(+)